MNDLERIRREHIEATIVAVLIDNWYRIARYDTAEIARPAIINIAREVREHLEKPLMSP